MLPLKMGMLFCRYAQQQQELQSCNNSPVMFWRAQVNTSWLPCRSDTELVKARVNRERAHLPESSGSIQFYSQIDKLLEGSDNDLRKAREQLVEKRSRVSLV